MDPKLVLKTCVFCVLFVMTLGISDDEMAQAVCTGIGASPGFYSAVRRRCDSTGESCETICRNAACSMRKIYGNQGSTAGTCIETLHLYATRNILKNGETGKATIAILRYGQNSCRTQIACGPNFCCCRA
uniref:Uncharacterized protein LOC111129233 n=1 Tax=Crassostrea virginica TaxID=6565 RepID=A0A8B8DTH9_CRAVI|nr:uncharacterized protein LOC111129233 [Crassostrea virginica]